MSNPLKNFAAASALATALTAPAIASPVYYDLTVTGTINSAYNLLDNSIPAAVIPTFAPLGSDITFVFRYDINAADTDPNANEGNFGGPLNSSLTTNGLSLNKTNAAAQPGSIIQQLSGTTSFYLINSGAYTVGLPTGTGSITAYFSARDGADLGDIFSDVNILNNSLNGLNNADLFSMGINVVGNGRGGVPFSIEESQLDNIRYSFKAVADEPPANNVPEPSSVALLGLGLAGAYVASRRREKVAPAAAPANDLI